MHVSRSTTRIHRPPGGSSTISFGDYEPAAATKAVVSEESTSDVTNESDEAVVKTSNPRHRAPGGASTISFGDYEPGAAAIKAAAAVAEEPISAATSELDEAADALAVSVAHIDLSITRGDDVKVGIAIAGDGADAIAMGISAALKDAGISSCGITKVSDVSVLPYVTQELTKTCDIVLSAAIITLKSQTPSSAIIGSLYEVGVRSGKAVIPGIINASSVLEGKAIVGHYAASWAKSISAVITLRKAELALSPLDAPVASLASQYTTTTLNVEVLLDAFRVSLQEHGARGIFGIGRKFKIGDDNGNGQLEFSEFSKVVAEHAMHWAPLQIRAVFDAFDSDKSGTISYNEFLVGVRGPMNERRQQLALSAFEVFDSDKSGTIDMKDIEAKYDASRHPDVISGRRTAAEVLREFLDTFDSYDKDGKVTPLEFLNYYNNVSASIDSDDYFELMIRNAWHISGGEGWCANTSCRRVLVTHVDGRQTVEEIKNDIGMRIDNVAAMTANLAVQGITDVVSIDATGKGSGVTITVAGKAATVANADAAPVSPMKPAAASAAGGRSNNIRGEEPIRPVTASSRRPTGGQSSINLGDELPIRPDTSSRRPTAGGQSSINLGDELPIRPLADTSSRRPTGGQSTINLADELPIRPAASTTSSRRPTGGQSSIVFG